MIEIYSALTSLPCSLGGNGLMSNVVIAPLVKHTQSSIISSTSGTLFLAILAKLSRKRSMPATIFSFGAGFSILNIS